MLRRAIGSQEVIESRPTTLSIEALDDWIVGEGLQSSSLDDFAEGLGPQLNAAGLQVYRLHISRSALDPSLEGTGCTWFRGEGVRPEGYAHGNTDTQRWHESPLKAMIDQRILKMRRRLVGPEARLDFPVLTEFRDAGGTDWIAYLNEFTPGDNPTALLGMSVTFASDAPDGFTAAQEAALDRLAQRIGLVVFRLTLAQTLYNVIRAYIGLHAGWRIVQGRIRRGDVERLKAAILFADLRGFTRFAETNPAEEVISGLNDYLGATVEAIAARGGEVLKFLGDGLLAVFDLEGRSEAETCAAALAAARDALAANRAINAARTERGETPLGLGIGLHLGEVLYGNVGAAERLDFTVIGPAVNQTSRIESLCGSLDVGLLTSERFARAYGGALKDLGLHELRGVAAPQRLFTLED